MREKYEELTQNERRLLLPVHYKHLLNLFVQLDLGINFLKVRKNVPTFHALKDFIEKSLSRRFSQQYF